VLQGDGKVTETDIEPKLVGAGGGLNHDPVDKTGMLWLVLYMRYMVVFAGA
jgi:hypothetical protein